MRGMRYLCLVYHDERKLAALSTSEYDTLVAETLAYVEEKRRSGHVIASNALEYVQSATSIRVRGDRLSITDGPFVATTEQLGGYILVEARDLNEAIRIAARIPPARMGGVEVRPVNDVTADLKGRRTTMTTDDAAPTAGSLQPSA